MNPDSQKRQTAPSSLLLQLKRRGVLRVAFSYAVISWLLLQIGDVVLEPMGAPAWVMRALIVLVAIGFPVAIVLAWFFELTPSGIEHDTLADEAIRPIVPGIRRYADIVIIGLLLIAVVFLLGRQEGWIKETSGPPVVGVLPFTELGAPEDSYFGSGMADSLTYKIGQLRQLIVLAPSSTMQFHGQGLDLLAVGAKLGATALLQGTVHRTNGTMQVNARLVDTGSGQQLWSGSFDRRGADLFAIQDEIATAVTQALQVILSPGDKVRLTQKPTLSLTAYDAYVLAQSKLATRRWENLPVAIDYLHRATETDPKYALAWAGLAQALALGESYAHWKFHWETVGGEADRAARLAQSLDPQLGEAYLAQAMVAEKDNESGARKVPKERIAALLKKAIDLSPNNAQALKMFATYVNSESESVAILKQAARLDPRSGIILLNIAESFIRRGDYDQALAWLLKSSRAVEPYFAQAYRAISQMYLYDAGRPDEAARWARAIRDKHPQDYRGSLDYLRALTELGAWVEAQAVLDAMPTDPPGSTENSFLWTRLVIGVRLAWLRGTFAHIPGMVDTFATGFAGLAESGSVWDWVGGDTMLAAMARTDLSRGQPEEAKQHLSPLAANSEKLFWENLLTLPVDPQIFYAVVKRQTGEQAEADKLLRKYLKQIRSKEITGINGIGFRRFILLAYLGETEAAMAELDSVVRSGWVSGWWALKEGGELDPHYAAVIADPRFKQLYRRLTHRVDLMREAFLAHPEVPEGTALK